MKYPFCIKISCLVDRRRSSIVPWIPPVDRVSSRSSSGIRFSTVLAALGTCGTSGPPIARDPDPRTALILFGFEKKEAGSWTRRRSYTGDADGSERSRSRAAGGFTIGFTKGNRQSRDRGSTRCDSLIITIESTRTSPCIATWYRDGGGWTRRGQVGREGGRDAEEQKRRSIVSKLTDLSRSVLLQAIVPESCRSQAHRVSVEMHNYIELWYKLC